MRTFLLDYEEGTHTTILFTSREDRFVALRVRVPPNELDEETSIVYGLIAPSLERAHAGWHDCNDTANERTVPDATVEDVIAALQWVTGKREILEERLARIDDGTDEKDLP